jgi:hypothetical protein
MERGGRDGEGREGWRVMERRGSDGGGVMEGEGMGCWAIVVDHGRSSSRSGGSLLAVCARHLSVGARCCLWEVVSVVHGR